MQVHVYVYVYKSMSKTARKHISELEYVVCTVY